MQKKLLNMVILYAFLVTGCGIAKSNPSPTVDQMDKSPFDGIPCAAPCWHGLDVGKSNESEVTSTLEKLTFINQNTIFFHRMSMPNLDHSTYAPGLEITATCTHSTKKCLTIDVVDNVLTEITIEFNYEITVAESIIYLGDPDYVGYQDLGAEQIICGIYLVWNEKRLVLFSKFDGRNAIENCSFVRKTGKTPSSLLISGAKYISEAVISNLLSSIAGEFFEFSGTLPEQ